MARYFAPVAALSASEKRDAYDVFEEWLRGNGKAPSVAVKKISKSKTKQETLRKYMGLLSVAADGTRSLLLSPNLRIVQMQRQNADDRWPYRNLIMSELRRVPSGHACVDDLNRASADNLLRVIMVRGKLGGDSEFGSNFVASVVHLFPGEAGDPPEAVVYNLAFKQMPMSNKAREEEFRRKNVMQEFRLMSACSKLVEQGVCPNLPIVYRAWECDDCQYWNPRLKRKGVPRSCLMMANELSTGGALSSWILSHHSQQAWQSCIFQIMAGLVAFHNIIGYMHDDLHYGNVLYDAIRPGGVWHYRFKRGPNQYDDRYVPNTGQQWKLFDFGLSHKVGDPRKMRTRHRMACDAMRILGILANPKGNEKPIPNRKERRLLRMLVDSYEDTGICDEEGRIDYAALPRLDFTPAYEMIVQLGWFASHPKGAVLNERPFLMKVY